MGYFYNRVDEYRKRAWLIREFVRYYDWDIIVSDYWLPIIDNLLRKK